MDAKRHVGIRFGGQQPPFTEMWEHLCAPLVLAPCESGEHGRSQPLHHRVRDTASQALQPSLARGGLVLRNFSSLQCAKKTPNPLLPLSGCVFNVCVEPSA